MQLVLTYTVAVYSHLSVVVFAQWGRLLLLEEIALKKQGTMYAIILFIVIEARVSVIGVIWFPPDPTNRSI